MRFALVNGQRQEAQPALSGECPSCRSPMVARCGEVRSWHWAHRGQRVCDPWWENETVWHRAWKDQFPADWQEIVHHAEDGERHIADVKTRDGWVVEFQHCHIRPDERRSREAFYEGLIWVVDGTRRSRDVAQFARAWANGHEPVPLLNKRRIDSPVGALLRDWAGSHAHVFFDFNNGRELWWLFPESDDTRAYVQPISRPQFVRSLRDTGLNTFDSLVNNFRAFVARYEPPAPTPRPRRVKETPPLPNRLPRIRRHFRF